MGRDGAKPTADKCHKNFNPLSPHGERPTGVVRRGGGLRFQSTLPAWGETCGAKMDGEGDAISIHSPRMGRDVLCEHMKVFLEKFQSTLPAWGETHLWHSSRRALRHFNPLSPHGERPPRNRSGRSGYYFNPLSPHGERPRYNSAWVCDLAISIHSPRMGRDSKWPR